MHLFSRKDAPIGDCPETSIARSPAVSMMSCAAFTIPEVGVSVPFGIMTELPLAPLVRVHPERSTGMLAFGAIANSRYSFFEFAEPAFEM